MVLLQHILPQDDSLLVCSTLFICLSLLTLYYLKHFKLVNVLSVRNNLRSNLKSNLHHFLTVALLTFLNVNILVILYKIKTNRANDSLILFSKLTVSKDSPINAGLLNQTFSKFQIPGYSFIEKKIELESSSKDNFKCGTIEFTDELESTDSSSIYGDLKRIRDQALELSKSDYPIAKNCFLDEKGEPEQEILKDKWAKFCGSSVWLSKYQVHFFVNRVVYAHTKERSRPTISLIDVQIFDQNWNEVEGFEIELSSGKKLHFPTLMKVNIDKNPNGKNSVMGAEDPRVVLRKFINENGEQEEEPIIIFNMRRTEIGWKRAMHMYRPFADEKTIRLSLRNQKPRFREKNWAPFFDEKDLQHIYFIYNFNPLRVIKCGLNDGVCDKITGPDFIGNKADESKHVGALRGGTNIVPIPEDVLPQHLKFRKFWFGIARSHNQKCGCLNEIYRPHSFIISKDSKTNEFTLDYVSSLIDFNVNAEPWDNSKSICDDGKNVLIPNSIAYWDFIYNNKDIDSDLMGVTFSEADRTNKIVHIKGFWQHILKALNSIVDNQNTNVNKLVTIQDHYASKKTEIENELLGVCSTSMAKQYCEKTAGSMNWISSG